MAEITSKNKEFKSVVDPPTEELEAYKSTFISAMSEVKSTSTGGTSTDGQLLRLTNVLKKVSRLNLCVDVTF